MDESMVGDSIGVIGMNFYSTRCGLLLMPAWAGGDVNKEANLHPKQPEPLPAAKLEAAIDKGVDFLVATQNKDGSWGSAEKTKQLNIWMPVPGTHQGMHVAVTAMC